MGFAINGLGRHLLCAIVECALMGAGTLSLAQEKSAKVVVIVDHPALDAVRDGMLEELKRQDFEAGKKLRWEYQSAQGNVATAAQIARKFVGDNPDVIISIATPTSQALVAATKTVPIVYSAVTDPVLARLVPSLAPSGTNVTGVADPLPLDQQIALIKRVAPTAKRIGIVYNPGEVNSVSAVEELRKLLPAAGMTLVEAPAQRSADVSTAVRSLIESLIAQNRLDQSAAASLMALSLFDTLEITGRTERQGELVLNMTDKDKNAAEVLYKTIEGFAQMFAATMF